MENELRPIGTVFSVVFPGSITAADNRPRKITYKVVGHVEALDEHRNIWKMEKLDVLQVEIEPWTQEWVISGH